MAFILLLAGLWGCSKSKQASQEPTAKPTPTVMAADAGDFLILVHNVYAMICCGRHQGLFAVDGATPRTSLSADGKVNFRAALSPCTPNLTTHSFSLPHSSPTPTRP